LQCFGLFLWQIFLNFKFSGNFELAPYLKLISKKFAEFLASRNENKECCQKTMKPIELFSEPKRMTLYGPPDASNSFKLKI
jgi:hypothetical protein